LFACTGELEGKATIGLEALSDLAVFPKEQA
jgi:hypothetical protein